MNNNDLKSNDPNATAETPEGLSDIGIAFEDWELEARKMEAGFFYE